MYKSDEKEIDAVTKVLKSKKFFRYQGPQVETITSQCEKEWNQFLESPFSLLNTSGTNALVVGMAAFGIGPGDEVIIPSYTFVATASAVMQVGAIPVIANVDESLTLDCEEVKKKITKETKAIVAVHMDGLISNIDELAKICCENNLFLVEDAAQACGGEYKGKKVGTLGAFGGFSFNVDKIISCGEGGLLTIGHKNFEREFQRAFVTHDTACQYGLTMKDQLKENSGFFGLSTRLNEINSAILSEQLKKLPGILSELRERKDFYRELFKSEAIPFREGHDPKGDIGTNIHLIGKDPIHVIQMTKSLVAKGFRAMPPHLRPAHACWQWFGEMNDQDYFVKKLNPFLNSSKKYSYQKSDYIRTVQLLSETCRLELEIDSSLDEFKKKAEEVVRIYKA
ncbi:MAG: aminotransferase class I/II-fold pyridoxal phosphate-dependent enzyme [Halobacteriovoraceae bacterium]|nr:aminotransferase class I/II-fold pyridoxal phosphate-dependent enzyme [Halobacteriovoraceae bacterium]